MPQSAYIALAVIAVLSVTAGTFHGWQAWRVHSLYEQVRWSKIANEPLQPSGKHLRALRRLRFAWDPLVENGGPMVDPFTPYGSKDIRDDLGPIIGTRDRLAVAKFHIEVSRALLWALKNAQLAEGRYRIVHLDNSTLESTVMKMGGGVGNLSPQQISTLRKDLPRLDSDGTFSITSAHRLLLKELKLQWPPHGVRGYSWEGWHQVLAVNFKRPFGDMTSFDLDMATILGRPSPKPDTEFDPALWRFYSEMWLALQAFVEHAQIPIVAE